MTSTEVAPATASEARDLTDQIKVAVDGTWQLIKRAYLIRADVALGYSSWDDYCTREFGTSRLRLPREERQEVVASMREIGMSTRAIAAATGIDRRTLQRNGLTGGGNAATSAGPENVTQLREYHDDTSADAECAEPEREETEDSMSARVIGLDGKTYQPESSKSKKSKPRRPSLPKQFQNLSGELASLVHRLERLRADDRFRANRGVIYEECGPRFRLALETITSLLNEIATEMEGEEVS